MSIRIASLPEFHSLNLAVVAADQFHRDILLQKGSAERIPIPAMRQSCVDCVADLIPHTLTSVKVVHDGVAAVLRHIQSVLDSQFAADLRIASEVLPGAEAFTIVVHTVEENVDVRIALGVIVSDHHVLGVTVFHQPKVFLCNTPHTFIVQQGRILLHEAQRDMSYRLIHGRVQGGLLVKTTADVQGHLSRKRQTFPAFT